MKKQFMNFLERQFGDGEWIMLITAFLVLPLLINSLNVNAQAQEMSEATSGLVSAETVSISDSSFVLVDNCNLFTEKEEELILQAQSDIYEETGAFVDIYACDYAQILKETTGMLYPDYTIWANKNATPGRITVLYTAEDSLNSSDKDISGHIRFTGANTVVGNSILDRLDTYHYKYDYLYEDNISYLGLDIYYTLESKVLGKDVTDVMETWAEGTEGHISPLYEYTTEESVTKEEPVVETVVETEKEVPTTDTSTSKSGHPIMLAVFLGLVLGIAISAAIIKIFKACEDENDYSSDNQKIAATACGSAMET